MCLCDLNANKCSCQDPKKDECQSWEGVRDYLDYLLYLSIRLLLISFSGLHFSLMCSQSVSLQKPSFACVLSHIMNLAFPKQKLESFFLDFLAPRTLDPGFLKQSQSLGTSVQKEVRCGLGVEWNPLSGKHEEEADMCQRQRRQWFMGSIAHVICDARFIICVQQLQQQRGLYWETQSNYGIFLRCVVSKASIGFWCPACP